jgi:ribokinase
MDIIAKTERLPKPGETVVGTQLDRLPGGKGANQAIGAARAGANTHMVGALGDDESAGTLKNFLDADGIDTSLLKHATGPSGTALVTVDSRGEVLVTVVFGANSSVDPAQVNQFKFEAGDILLIQHEIPVSSNHAAIMAARAAGGTVVYNPAPFKAIDPSLLRQIDYLIVNEHEFVGFAQLRHDFTTPEHFAHDLEKGLTEPKNIIITLGADGVLARLEGKIVRLPGHHVKAVDSTGAGDCFCGAFGAALAEDSSPAAALKFANAAAAISVTRPGAGPAMPHRDEIEAFLN